MILLDALLTDFVFETIRFIVLVAVMIAGIFVGKKLRDKSDAKKASLNHSKEV